METLGSIRTEAAPQRTITAYKLMRLVDGKLYPLYIDRAKPLEIGVWYNADAPSLDVLQRLDFGNHLIDLQTQRVIDHRASISKEDIKRANDNNQRWIHVIKQATKIGYKQWGISKSGGKEVANDSYAYRPGWHAGQLPVMNQVAYSKTPETPKGFLDEGFVFTEIEISADIDYRAVARANGGELYYLPENGYYIRCTNANRKAAQADELDWYIAGAIKINRIISDREARQIIDRYNRAHGTHVAYSVPRKSGKMFNADTMQLEGAQVDTFIDIVKDMENQSTKKAGTNPANLRQHNAEPSVETLFGRKSSLLGSSNNTFSQIDIDEAKVEKNTQSAKNNLKKYRNGDYKPFDIPLKKLKLESLGRVLLWLRRLFKMIYHGQSSYNYYTTPKGLLNFRISNHKANPKNFRANNADFNVSVYVALLERNYNSDADVDYMEYRYSREDYEAHAEEIVEAIIKGFDHALQTGEFIDYSGYATPLHHKGLSGSDTPIDERREAGKVLAFMLHDCFVSRKRNGQTPPPTEAMVIGDYLRIATWNSKLAKTEFDFYLGWRCIKHAFDCKNENDNEFIYTIKDGQLDKVKQAVGYKEKISPRKFKVGDRFKSTDTSKKISYAKIVKVKADKYVVETDGMKFDYPFEQFDWALQKGYFVPISDETADTNRLKLLKLKAKAAKAKMALMKIDGLAGLGWPHFPFVLAIKEFRADKPQPVNLWITSDNAAIIFVKKKEQKSYPATSNEFLYQQLLRLCRERDILINWYNCKVSPRAYNFEEYVYSVGTYSTDLKTEYEAGSVNWFTKRLFDKMTVKEIEEKLNELESEIKKCVQRIKEDNSTIEGLKAGSYFREQYDKLKGEHIDAILLFRVGDFYKAYYDDAKEIAPILDITLTTVGENKMAGFPATAIDTYLPKLVRAGKRVAIVDNITDIQKREKNLNLLKLKAKAAKAKLELMKLNGLADYPNN